MMASDALSKAAIKDCVNGLKELQRKAFKGFGYDI